MAQKIAAFIISKRFRIWVSPGYRFYSISCAAQVQTATETDQRRTNSAELESAVVSSVKNKLNPGRLTRVLDSSHGLSSSDCTFKRAQTQKNSSQNYETYARVVLELGLAGDHVGMDSSLKEMVKLECPNLEGSLVYLINSLCKNARPREALLVIQNVNLAEHRLPLSSCNALLGALVTERGNFPSMVFVYKEMVKAGIFPDVETLNHLMAAMCDVGNLNLALKQFHRMSKKRCTPNGRTFEILISSLCSGDRVDESIEVFNQMLEQGCSPHHNFYANIIPLFCEYGKLKEAKQLLRMMKDAGLSPDLHICCTLIQSLCENLEVDDAVDILEEMQKLDIFPVTSIYVEIIHAYCELGQLDDAVIFLKDNTGLEVEPYNRLLQGYCGVGRFQEATSFVEKMAQWGLCNVNSWNIVIRQLCEEGHLGRAFEVLGRMVVYSYMPDQGTYSAILVGYCNMHSYDDGLDYFGHISMRNMSMDTECCSKLVHGLCQVKKLNKAVEVFYYMIDRGGTIMADALNVLIEGICFWDTVDEAIKLRSLAFCRGTFSTPATYAPIIHRLLKLNRAENILVILPQMFVEGFALDPITYCSLIRGLCAERTAREACLLFNQMLHSDLNPDSDTLELLLSCLENCSQLHKLIHSIPRLTEGELLNPKMCNMVIFGLLREGYNGEACKLLDWMLEKGWVPDADTHGLLVGTTEAEKRVWATDVREDTGDDKVSNILADGLEDHNKNMVEQ